MENKKIMVLRDNITIDYLDEFTLAGYELQFITSNEFFLKLGENFNSNISCIIILIKKCSPQLFSILEQWKKVDHIKKIPFIVIIDEVADDERHLYELGVSDVILSKCDKWVITKRIKNVIELSNYKNELENMVVKQTSIVLEQAKQLQELNDQIVDTMSTIVEFRDLDSGQHINRIKGFTRVLGKSVKAHFPEFALTDNQIEMITMASSLHDVGKIAIPDSILLKKGKLTKEEFEIMKTHTLHGCEILQRISSRTKLSYFEEGLVICQSHHERYDGKGYPLGLVGEDIPIAAQLVALADVYDALVCDRVYKKAIPNNIAFEMIMNGECGTMSPKMLQCFEDVKDEFEELSNFYV